MIIFIAHRHVVWLLTSRAVAFIERFMVHLLITAVMLLGVHSRLVGVNFFDWQDIEWVQTEKHVFEIASNYPFLVGLHSCFQSESRLVKKLSKAVVCNHIYDVYVSSGVNHYLCK